MNNTKNNNFSAYHSNWRRQHSEPTDFYAPLGTLKSSRLVFASGAVGLSLTSDPAMPYLYRARFKHNAPRIWLQDGILTVAYPRLPLAANTVDSGKPLTEIRMNGSIPWEIEFRKGVSQLNANLGQFQLGALDILGGANQIRLALSKPAGTTFIYISGGIRQGTIHIPPAAGVRVQIRGGGANMIFEGQRLGVVSGETSLETPNFENRTLRYDICIAGGVSDLSIGSRL
jgi:hypothetical protein